MLIGAGQVLIIELLAVHPVEEEVYQIQHDRLAAFFFDDIDDIVVRIWMVFDEDLADHADARLFDPAQRHGIVIPDNLLHQPLVGTELAVAAVFENLGLVFFHDAFRRARNFLIRSGRVKQSLEKISVHDRKQQAFAHRRRNLKSRIALQTRHIEGYHRHLLHMQILERLTQQRDIVAGSAAAARL